MLDVSPSRSCISPAGHARHICRPEVVITQLHTSRITPARRFAISDVHGHLHPLRAQLDAHQLARGGHWTGGDHRLWFLGDYVDRGEEGLEVVDLVRRLQVEAAEAGGSITPLLGNHELQFLAALHFGDRDHAGGRSSWLSDWQRYGGVDAELRTVSEEQVDWMTQLPLVDADEGLLFVHSDSEGYLHLGSSVTEINAAGREILHGREPSDWKHLHGLMTRRGDFFQQDRVERILDALGMTRIVHGHSTLGSVFGLDREATSRPHVYASGLVTAIDGGVFEGGSIVVAEL